MRLEKDLFIFVGFFSLDNYAPPRAQGSSVATFTAVLAEALTDYLFDHVWLFQTSVKGRFA